ncbi:hypothetical protein HQ576_20890, partial [bacterium]|nr:hypothetical protein [bacterium]
FFRNELRSLSVGPFWGEAAQKVSRASNLKYADPLPAILDFKAQLDKAGIEFLLVPVPAKAVIYPEFICEAVSVAKGAKPPRLDIHLQAFIKLLRQKGVAVVDLVPHFHARRFDEAGLLYCRQDTHWSGRACALTADLIAKAVGGRPWLKAVPKRALITETRPVEIAGDLWRDLGDPSLAKETLPLTFVGEKTADGLEPVAPWRESPVLLLGDSHTLVFHTGAELHARGAGLPDHLARVFGFPVDLVGVRGSGSTTARISLFRRRDNLKGKKLLIWCFAANEFTESFSGWRKVPVIR